MVCIIFLALRFRLTLGETILGTVVMIKGLKMIFPLKAEAAGCFMELILVTTILSIATWFVDCIQQPKEFSFRRYSNFPGISINLHCLGPYILDHHYALAIFGDIVA